MAGPILGEGPVRSPSRYDTSSEEYKCWPEEGGWIFSYWLELTRKLEVLCLLQQEFDVGEVLREDRTTGPHEVQYVPEHSSIPVTR